MQILSSRREAGQAATRFAACAGAGTIACLTQAAKPILLFSSGRETASWRYLVGHFSKQAENQQVMQKPTTMSSLAFSTRLSTPYSVPLYRSRLPAWHRACSCHAVWLHPAAA